MRNKRVLWLEDQYEDFASYLMKILRAGYLVDTVRSVSEAERKLREENYVAAIIDIHVLPGDDQKWVRFDDMKRSKYPTFDPQLGLELLRSIFNPQAEVMLSEPIQIDPRKIIIFSVVYDRGDEIADMGIPVNQIVYKSDSDLTTLPNLIREIEEYHDK